MKFKTRNVKAYKILEDDRLKIGGKMHQVTSQQPHTLGSDRVHICAHLLGGDPRYDRVSLFVPGNMKIKIYNQK